jgi:hypothetical protein
MVYKDANFPPKKSGAQDDTDPVVKYEAQAIAIKQEFDEQLAKIKAMAQQMEQGGNDINVSYLMLMFTSVVDIQVAMGAGPLQLADAIRQDFHSISQSINESTDLQDLTPGGKITIGGTNYTFEGLSKDGTQMTVQESPPGTINLFNQDGSLADGVPFFRLGGKYLNLTFTGDPMDTSLTAWNTSGIPVGAQNFANKMIKADGLNHTKVLTALDAFRQTLKNYQTDASHNPSLPDVSALLGNVEDVIAGYGSSNLNAYCYEASTGAYIGITSDDVDACKSALGQLNSSNNAFNTALNSAVSQGQIQLNQAEGQYQSCMTAIGGSISQFKDQINSWISNMRS